MSNKEKEKAVKTPDIDTVTESPTPASPELTKSPAGSVGVSSARKVERSANTIIIKRC